MNQPWLRRLGQLVVALVALVFFGLLLVGPLVAVLADVARANLIAGLVGAFGFGVAVGWVIWHEGR